MRRFDRCLGGALLLLATHAGAARAQDDAAPGNLRERTGPAAPFPVPEYPAPAPAIAEPPMPPETPPAAGLVTFSDIRVVDRASVSPAASETWVPEVDPATNINLLHRPAEPLDAAWVARQFVENGLIGRPVPLDRIIAVTQQINRAYIANGYLNSGVLISGPPPVDGGVLELTLIGGRLVSQPGDPTPVRVAWGPNGNRGLSEDYIRNRMRAANEVPLNTLAIERQFRLLAEDPAIRTINADLRPGAQPGEAVLALTVDPQPQFDTYLTVANNRSPSIGGERFAIGGSVRSAFTPGDLLGGEAGLTGDRADFAIGYEAPIFDQSTYFSIRGGYNEAAVIDRPLIPLDISSTDHNIEGGVTRRLLERPLSPGAEPGQWIAARTISVGLRYAWRRTDTFLFGQPFSFSPGAVDGRAEYSALRLTGDFVQRDRNQVVAASVTLTQGLGGTRSDIPGLPTPDEMFRVAIGRLSFARRLNDRGLELRMRAAGQWADGLLYSGERFAAGGENSVRGYRETVALADTGVFGSVELARSFSISRSRSRPVFDWGSFSTSVFLDGAALWNANDPQPNPDSIYSVGVSLVWTPSDAVFARVTFAEGLKSIDVIGNNDIQDRGFEFRVTIRPLEFFRR